MKKARVLLADDHTMVVEGLKRLLEQDFELVGAAEDGRALLAKVEESKPDIILMDIAMPLLNGIDAARIVHKDHPEVKIIFLTMHADPIYVEEALRVGASGYLLKRSAASELGTAVREVMGGRSYITPLVTGGVMGSLLRRSSGASRRLTPRQREVLQLVAEGHSNKEIAGVLHISVKTAEFHKAEIMQRLDLHTTAELTQYAIRNGILPS